MRCITILVARKLYSPEHLQADIEALVEIYAFDLVSVISVLSA